MEQEFNDIILLSLCLFTSAMLAGDTDFPFKCKYFRKTTESVNIKALGGTAVARLGGVARAVCPCRPGEDLGARTSSAAFQSCCSPWEGLGARGSSVHVRSHSITVPNILTVLDGCFSLWYVLPVFHFPLVMKCFLGSCEFF